MYEKALSLIQSVYDGQVNKAGEPYINHLLTVADCLTSETEKITALLHNIVDNLHYTCEELTGMGFPVEVIEAVECLARHIDSGYKPKNEDEDYSDYLWRISDNEIATNVKLAYLHHNMDLSRLHEITEEDKRRAERHKEAFMFLRGVAATHTTGMFAAWSNAANNNVEQLDGASLCGCFYCLEIFSPSEIYEWCDGGETAMCPHCGIDSIISGDSDYPVTKEFLELMHGRWFCTPDWEDKITREEIINIARKFIESEAMSDHIYAEHLRSNTGMPIYRSYDMITASRGSLENKISALKEISVKVDDIKNKLSEIEIEKANSLVKLITAGEFAINELTQNIPIGTVFLLTGNVEDEWKFSIPFTSLEAAKCYITKNNEEYLIDYDVELWEYIVEKWIPEPDGEMQNIVNWHMSHDGAIWFAHINAEIENLKALSDDGEPLSPYSYNEIAYITIPFEVGDIITIDCRPTHDICHAVVAEILEDGHDCCGIQVIYLTTGGEIEQGALKHNRAINSKTGFPMFTCMFRLEKFTGELPLWETPLKIISEELKRDPECNVYGDNINKNFLKRFNSNIINFLPNNIAIGDVLRYKSVCRHCGVIKRPHNFAVLVGIGNENIDVVICEDEELKKVALKYELGCKARFYFENYTDELSGNLTPLQKISYTIKCNPDIVNDKDFWDRLNTVV